MNKIEFLEGLQAALVGRVNSSLIQENIDYYREYIDSQVRQGRWEAEIVEELGDPRLLAKSIAEANKHAGESVVYEEMEDKGTEESSTGQNRSFRFPGWLILVIVVLIVMSVFGFIVTMVSWMAPVLIPLLVIGFIIKLVRSAGR